MNADKILSDNDLGILGDRLTLPEAEGLSPFA